MRVASFSRGITGTLHLSITHEPRLYVFAQLHVFFSICWVRPLLPPPPHQLPHFRAQRDFSTMTSLPLSGGEMLMFFATVCLATTSEEPPQSHLLIGCRLDGYGCTVLTCVVRRHSHPSAFALWPLWSEFCSTQLPSGVISHLGAM